MLSDDGAGGIVISAPVVESNVVDIIQPDELDKMHEMLEAFGACQLKAPGILAAIRQWVVNGVRIGKW